MLVVFYFIIKDDYQNILYNLSIANRGYLLLGVIFVLLYYFLKAVCIYSIAKEHNEKITMKQMINQTLITQFFNGITPFSTGGQPMQIYMLKNSGIPVGSATNIIIQDFLMYQLALITMGIVALVSNTIFHFFDLLNMLNVFLKLYFPYFPLHIVHIYFFLHLKLQYLYHSF